MARRLRWRGPPMGTGCPSCTTSNGPRSRMVTERGIPPPLIRMRYHLRWRLGHSTRLGLPSAGRLERISEVDRRRRECREDAPGEDERGDQEQETGAQQRRPET